MLSVSYEWRLYHSRLYHVTYSQIEKRKEHCLASVTGFSSKLVFILAEQPTLLSPGHPLYMARIWTQDLSVLEERILLTELTRPDRATLRHKDHSSEGYTGEYYTMSYITRQRYSMLQSDDQWCISHRQTFKSGTWYHK